MGGCVGVYTKSKTFGGGKFLTKDFVILLPKGRYTFCPKFCP
jgi:hypothetical protein